MRIRTQLYVNALSQEWMAEREKYALVRKM
jgi:hypothetical protein